MPDVLTRADALREYLTGAVVDGGPQSDPDLALGGCRSSFEATSFTAVWSPLLANVTLLYASGGHQPGTGTLSAIDANHLTWQAPGMVNPGPPAFFSGTDQLGIVEAAGNPGIYLRVKVTTPLAVSSGGITLSYAYGGLFGVGDVSATLAGAGGNLYRSSLLRNEGGNAVTAFKRWLSLLGTQQAGNLGALGLSGAGALVTSGTFLDWPGSGYAQVRTSGGALREVVYYSSRSNTTLVVPSAGRGLLSTAASAGSLSDLLYPVPGVALGFDPAGVQSSGSTFQSVLDGNTVPVGVTWNREFLADAGVQLAGLDPGKQVALWFWKQVPAGEALSAYQLNRFSQSFNTF